MKAIIRNLGRNKINKEIEIKSILDLEKEIGRYILSKNWFFEAIDDSTYLVIAGFRVLGVVELKQTENENRDL